MFNCRRCERDLPDEARADHGAKVRRGRICYQCFRAQRNEYRKTSETHRATHREYQRAYMAARRKEGQDE